MVATEPSLTQTAEQSHLTLCEAAKITPTRISANGVWRWCRVGVKTRAGHRITLQHIRVGGRVFTSRQWLDEFFHAVAEADREHFQPKPQPTVPAKRTDRQRQKAIAKAKAELAAAGY